MKNSAYILLTLLALLFACTKAELCEEGDHPHRAGVRFAYDWSTVNSDPRVSFHGTMPSTEKDTVMLTIVKRIIGTEITGCVFNVIKNKGYYLTNAPAASVLPTDGDDSTSGGSPAGDGDDTGGSDTGDGGTPTTGDGGDGGTDGGTDTPAPARVGEVSASAPAQEVFDVDLFKIRPGTFKMMTVNRDTTEFLYNDILTYIESSWAEAKLHDLCVEYKRYRYGSAKLRNQVPGWTDYNIYGNPDETGHPSADNYLQPDMAPVYYDSIAPCDIARNSEQLFTFKPELLTQNIDIRFHIRKKVDVMPFSIEAVYADISGIPFRINLSTGLFDIRNTAKMMFTCKMEDANGNEIVDDDANTYLLCHGNIDVLSLVNAPNADVIRGPGIMQLMIRLKDNSKVIRLRINLRHAIERANLYQAIDDGAWAHRRKAYGTLEIDTGLVIDEKFVITNDEEGGLDKWIDIGKDEIIVDA